MSSLPDNHDNLHEEIGAYVTGLLSGEGKLRFEKHLKTCEACQRELVELWEVDELVAIAAPPVDYPEGLESRVMDSVRAVDPDREARIEAASAPPRIKNGGQSRSFFRIPRTGFAFGFAVVVAALVVAVFAGTRIGDDDSSPIEGGPIELAANLESSDGAAGAHVDVTKLATGREITFESTTLPILPPDRFYQLWFVGQGDSPSGRNRISAGTFHPDEQGDTRVILHAAVDPARYSEVEVTEGPAEGGPQAVGAVVLRYDPGS